jgi:hypothetical protein
MEIDWIVVEHAVEALAVPAEVANARAISTVRRTTQTRMTRGTLPSVLDKSDPGTRAALAASVALLACAGVALARLAADALELRSADARYVAIVYGLALPLYVARLLRPESSRAARGTIFLLGLPWLLALVWPRSWLLVSWLSGGALVLAGDAIVYASRRAWSVGERMATKLAFAAVVLLPSLYLFAAVFVIVFNTQLIIVPARLLHQRPVRDHGESELELTTRDGYALGATYTPGHAGRPGVVLVHGVSDGRSRFVPWARRLRADGYHVLRYDARAHGTSEGAVCTYGQREVADVRAAVDRLRAMNGVDRDRVAVVGASMGGGTVLAASPSLRSRGVRALVTLAPASRYGPLVRARVAFLGPLATAVLDGTSRVATAMHQTPMASWSPGERHAELPLLVIHGTADTTIPIALSERLAREQSLAELTRLPGVAHDELSDAVAEHHFAVVRRFLARELGSTDGGRINAASEASP